MPENCNVLRFFSWWKNGKERTDIDLSAAMYNEDFVCTGVVSYYNLKEYGGVHSGDIVDAPKGASEFIDIPIQSMVDKGIRYLVMSLNSYSQQPFCELPECFAGWMSRSKPKSGEIYDPKTVQDRLDITADTRIAIPLIIDVVDKEVIWCDMALKRNPRWQNNVGGNLKGISLTLRAMVNLKKTTLYDLLKLHAEARGELVESRDGAETVFSAEDGFQFRTEEIASSFMA